MNQFIFLVQQTMFFFIPLLVVAIGGMFSERSGVVNIALEGIMLLGAFAGILFISKVQQFIPGQSILLLAMLLASLIGALVALTHAYAAIRMNANQVISGTAINMFAPAFAIYVARQIGKTQQVSFLNEFKINAIPLLSQIPILGKMFFTNTYISNFIGIVIFFLAKFVLYKTKFGLRLRACGEHPQAADSVGVNVAKTRYLSVCLSGALAGFGGLILIIPTAANFNATVSGYGFLALAVLIFGQWQPNKILLAAFFFGLMKTIASAYSTINFLAALNLPNEIYQMIPFIATILALTLTSKHSQSPKSLGIPYDKSAR